MFNQAKKIICHTSGLSSLKLLLATASFSRPRLAVCCNLLLRGLSRDGKLSIKYRTKGQPRRILLRLAHLQSDLCSAMELAVDDCYGLDDLPVPSFIVDGGGNTGLFTLAASARWPSAQVIICEPVPENISILQENLTINRVKAELLPVCLGGEAGHARFYCRDANQGSFSADLPYRAVIDVRVQTLSEICRGREDQETLIKLDIEGAEVAVLEEFLKIPRPHTKIVGELHDHESQKEVIVELARSSGRLAQFIREDGETSQFQILSPDSEHSSVSSMANTCT